MRFQSKVATAALLTQRALAGPRCCTSTISRDVAIVGGGAAGSHAAVWLRDHNKSVIVIEKASQLGGHTAYYEDPATGFPINVGVQAWMDYKDSLDFPRRMNISTGGSMQFPEVTANFIDFESGEHVENWVPPAPDAMFPAIQRYLDVLQKYDDILLPGFLSYSFPDEVPEDFTMTFGELVQKYDLADAVPQIWDSTGMGLGRPMDIPALFMMQASAAPMAQALLGEAASVVPDSGRLWDLYDSVQSFLGDDVLYSSSIVSSERSEDGVQLLVRGPESTCIKAKKLLIAAQPTPETMQPFDLSVEEEEVFAKFAFATVYAGVLQHPSLQVRNAYSNRSPEPGSTEYLVWPEASQVGRIDWLGNNTDDLFQFTAVGEEDFESAGMKGLIGDAINTMIDAGTLKPSTPDGGLTFAAFADHGKMHPHVTAEDLKNGFIQRLINLQGQRSTWYTGAAFSAGFSTIIWEYNKVILPSLIEGM